MVIKLVQNAICAGDGGGVGVGDGMSHEFMHGIMTLATL